MNVNSALPIQAKVISEEKSVGKGSESSELSESQGNFEEDLADELLEQGGGVAASPVGIQDVVELKKTTPEGAQKGVKLAVSTNTETEVAGPKTQNDAVYRSVGSHQSISELIPKSEAVSSKDVSSENLLISKELPEGAILSEVGVNPSKSSLSKVDSNVSVKDGNLVKGSGLDTAMIQKDPLNQTVAVGPQSPLLNYLRPGQISELKVSPEKNRDRAKSSYGVSSIAGGDFIRTLNQVKDGSGAANLSQTLTSGHPQLNEGLNLEQTKSLMDSTAQPISGESFSKGLSDIELGAKSPLLTDRSSVSSSPLLQGAAGASMLGQSREASSGPAIKLPVMDVAGQVVKGSMAKDRLSSSALANIATSIGQFKGTGGGEIRLKLKPENLGEIHLKVSTFGNNVSLKMQTSDLTAKGVIEESMHHLKQALSSQNLNLGRVDLSVMQHASGSSSFHHGDSQFNQDGFDRNAQQNYQGALSEQSRDGWQQSGNDGQSQRGENRQKISSVQSLSGLSSISGAMHLRHPEGAGASSARLDVIA